MSPTVRTLQARHAEARGLPSALPESDVEVIPFFGRTWYTRRAGYYLRRALAVGLLLVGLAVVIGLDVGLWTAFDGASPTGRAVWRVILGVLFVLSFIWPIRRLVQTERRRRAGEVLDPDYLPGVGRRRPAAGAGIGALARAGSSLAGAFLAIGSTIFLGWFVVLFVQSFQREYGLEHDARLRLQRHEKWRTPSRPAGPVD